MRSSQPPVGPEDAAAGQEHLPAKVGLAPLTDQVIYGAIRASPPHPRGASGTGDARCALEPLQLKVGRNRAACHHAV